MYLHLGQETIVKTDEIIGLFDLDSTTLGSKTREFLAKAEGDGRVINVSTELPKSFVLAAAERASPPALYISQLGTATLKKRFDQGYLNIHT